MTRQRAFTLVEVLVTLGLLTLVAVLAYRGIAALVEGEGRLTAEASRWRALDAALARLEADLRQAVPRAVRVGGGSEPAWLGAIEANGASALVISRAGSEFDADPGVAGQRIGYRLRGDALQVVYWGGLDRATTGESEARAWTLAEGVAAFRLQHLGEREWRDAWPAPGEPDLPRAVRVELTLAGGETIDRWFALR